jgi:hypothetical protein
VQEYVQSRNLSDSSITGQLSQATRTTISQQYFAQMHSSRIIVTVNPSYWEGDFRLWEALASGALVFVDHLYVPHPMPLVHKKHVIFYDNNNRTELFDLLDYYRSRDHEEEARRIAEEGYLHCMKHHRAANLIDYVLRSAHIKWNTIHSSSSSSSSGGNNNDNNDVPAYSFSAQYLRLRSKEQEQSIIRNRYPGDYSDKDIMINHTHCCR